MVEVFKTNVQSYEQSERLLSKLLQQFPELKINFDLEDCDKILRVKGAQIPLGSIISLLNSEGFACAPLF
jgi:hypothetical protein